MRTPFGFMSSGTTSCTSSALGTWTLTSSSCVSGNITTNNETITVPAGNSGSIDIVIDSGSTTTQYSKNGGAFTSAPLGTTNVTFANGDTLKFKSISNTTCVVANTNNVFSTGTVKDHTTGATLDTISLAF